MIEDKQLLALALALALFTLIFSKTTNATNSLSPRVSADAYTSDYTVGQADLMFPLNSNNTHNFYVNPSMAYGTDNQGYTDLGLGYRWIKNNAAILGFYLFGGYTRIDNNARLWVVNPGIEALGSRWDAHLNSYFSMGDKHQTLNPSVNFASSRFVSGHFLVADINQLTQYAGNGADIKFGYQLFLRIPLKAYVGSYFFSPAQTDNQWGGATGLEYWLDPHLKIFANYTYDNYQHSTAALGLGIEFGGAHVHRSNPSLEERFTDPVERYLAELGRGSGIPSQINAQAAGQQLLGSFAFFSQTGGPNNGGIALTLADCTFENPCGPTDFSQTGVDTLNILLPNTHMYFNGGSYPSAAGATITLNTGQSISSRTSDYSAPATGAARSTFNGAFILNSNNSLNNIILLPTPATADGNGVTINGGTNDVITGSQIGNDSNPYNTGVLIDSTQLAINNSTVSGVNRGIRAQNFSTLSIQGSQIDAIHNTGGATGISLSQSMLVFDNSQIFAQAPGSASGMINGINALSGSTAQIINQSSILAVQTGAMNSADGLQTDANSSQQMTGGTISVIGTTPVPTSGPNITLNGVTCIVNGVPTAC